MAQSNLRRHVGLTVTALSCISGYRQLLDLKSRLATRRNPLFIQRIRRSRSHAKSRSRSHIARFVRRDPSATVDDWVRVFKQKRDEIVKRACSS
jgi:hypothetical protein